MLDLIYDENDFIVLDFFAGSGTTGHALMKSNIIDNGKRTFLCVQLDEAFNEKKKETKWKKISNLTIERLRRASRQILNENKKSACDCGFHVFKLTLSNFKEWQNYEGTDVKQLEKQLELHVSPLEENWKEENLLNEILLIEGFPLDSKIEVLSNYKKNKAYRITSDFCEHALLICLDKKVQDETIKSLQLNESDIFICLDTAISDQDKVRLSDKGLIKTI